MTPATLSIAARRLYAQVEHLEVDGESEGWPWATLCAALAKPLDNLYELAVAADDPWAPAFDPRLGAEVWPPETASAMVHWLGPFAGVTERQGLAPAGQRLRLRETSGARRGSPGAIIAGARQRLGGPDGTPESAQVLLVERIGDDPYHFAVTVKQSETPDPAGTRRESDPLCGDLGRRRVDDHSGRDVALDG